MANCTRWSRVQLCHSGVYEIDKFIVYKFTVYHIVYSKLLLQVYKFTLDGLQQIAATYKSLTNQWAIILLHCWQSVFQPISELLHFFHCLHVQEKPVTTLIGIYFTVGVNLTMDCISIFIACAKCSCNLLMSYPYTV